VRHGSVVLTARQDDGQKSREDVDAPVARSKADTPRFGIGLPALGFSSAPIAAAIGRVAASPSSAANQCDAGQRDAEQRDADTPHGAAASHRKVLPRHPRGDLAALPSSTVDQRT
jgi:hypothetical protein